MSDPVVHLTNGVPDSGTGNITTLGQTLLDGANATIGAKADAASTATDTTAASAMSIWKQISKTLQAAAGAVATAFFVKLTDGTNTARVLAGSTTPQATDPAIVVALSPNGINANGAATSSNSAPMVPATDWVGTTALSKFSTGYYVAVAASQTASVLQSSTGATGDYISGVLVIPATTSPGNVLLLDNATSMTVFAGGASSVSNLVPFFVPLGAVSRSGAWKLTTGANVSCIAVGKFS